MIENLMEKSRLIELMAKKMGKSASGEDVKELDRLLAAYPSYTYLEEIARSLKGSPEHFGMPVEEEAVVDSGWKRLAGKLEEDPGEEAPPVSQAAPVERVAPAPRRLWPRLTIAASLLLLGAGAAWYFHNTQKPPVPMARVTHKLFNVRYGSAQQMFVLEDGTKVWLNAGSRLTYPDVFTGSSRDVELEGEAFFDVAQHASMPFLVHADKVTVKVLGTRFNLKAYREDASVTTTLISGKVQVSMDDDPERKIILSPHEKLILVKTGEIKSISHNALRYQVQSLPEINDAPPETAWMENKLVFSDEPFDEVARLLERKYDVQIEFENEDLKAQHLSGVFEKESLKEVLDILRMTTRFHYQIEGKKVSLIKGSE